MVECGKAAFATCDRLQNYPVEAQLLGLSAAFVLMCRESGVHPRAVYEATDNLLHDGETVRPEFRGVAAYIRNEVLTRSKGMIE